MDLMGMHDYLLGGGGGRKMDGGIHTWRFVKPGERMRGGKDDSVHDSQLSQVASRMLMDGKPTTADQVRVREALTKTSDHEMFLLQGAGGSAATNHVQMHKAAARNTPRTLHNQFIAKEMIRRAGRATIEHIGGPGSTVLINCTPRSARVQAVRGENNCGDKPVDR